MSCKNREGQITTTCKKTVGGDGVSKSRSRLPVPVNGLIELA